MKLEEIVSLPPPAPWSDADNIPWSEPGFSRRMLREHLSQLHDAASRRSETIDAQVNWISALLTQASARILDLGCGPGLYTSRLAQLGHECVGIDYSPASIVHAREVAGEGGLRCTYIEEDLRLADFGEGYDLVMLISGELNVFSPPSARTILNKARAALKPAGRLLLEVHPFGVIQKRGHRVSSWYGSQSGLFSELPHLCLQQHAWDETIQAASVRYIVIDATSGDVTVYGQTFQAYSEDDYELLLEECGFVLGEVTTSMTGAESLDPDFEVIVGRPR